MEDLESQEAGGLGWTLRQSRDWDRSEKEEQRCVREPKLEAEKRATGQAGRELELRGDVALRHALTTHMLMMCVFCSLSLRQQGTEECPEEQAG